MSDDASPDPRADAVASAALALDVRRLADRLRSMPQSRLQVRLEAVPALPPAVAHRAPAAAAGDTRPPRLTRASLAHALAQHLADATAGIDARAAPGPPPRRAVPMLSVFAVGDQVAVTGADLATALRGLDPATPVWDPDGARSTAGAVLDAALEAVRAIRGLA